LMKDEWCDDVDVDAMLRVARVESSDLSLLISSTREERSRIFLIFRRLTGIKRFR